MFQKLLTSQQIIKEVSFIASSIQYLVSCSAVKHAGHVIQMTSHLTWYPSNVTQVWNPSSSIPWCTGAQNKYGKDSFTTTLLFCFGGHCEKVSSHDDVGREVTLSAYWWTECAKLASEFVSSYSSFHPLNTFTSDDGLSATSSRKPAARQTL